MRKNSTKWVSSGLAVLFILSLLSGCIFPTSTDQSSQSQANVGSTVGKVEITFKIKIGQLLSEGETVYLSLLDEVSGLAFNAQQYRMSAADGQNYAVTIPFQPGIVIKYRYSREGARTILETTGTGESVRYRLYLVEASNVIEDVISGWSGIKSSGPYGRITGQVLDSITHEPIPSILISAGGDQVFSHGDGSFSIDGISTGLSNLVFYSIDGSFETYQQGAVVNENSTTPVTVFLIPAEFVTVIFAITVPKDTPPDVPIRFAGNLYQLGNTFADLAGGVSSLPSRMPILGKLPDGRYMLTVNLPVGATIDYKYTLGDGLWSSELASDGSLLVRHLLIPNEGLTINDTVETWKNESTIPIRFEVKVPQNTPDNEDTSIQFNPGFGWMEPLPMQPASNSEGERAWIFDLTGPFIDFNSLKYRYCRQEQCGIADDASTKGVNPEDRAIVIGKDTTIIHDEIFTWAWLKDINTIPRFEDVHVKSRSPGFVTGISLLPSFRPSWGSSLDQSITSIKSLQANTLILSPTWTFTNSGQPILEPDSSKDMLWIDVMEAASFTHREGLDIGLFPTPNFPTSGEQWWHAASRDYAWWLTFFDQYSSFIIHNALSASKINASNLILGGNWILPALPGGLLRDGTSSNVPQDAELRWRLLIQDVRENYNGKIAWALSYPDGVLNPPAFLDAVDQVYILWSAPLASNQDDTIQAMETEANYILNQEIYPFQQQVGKPTILAISYPSITRGAMGCIQLLGGGCLDYAWLSPPNQDIAELELNLQDQANAYYAVLSAINDKDWISGFVSMGYYPPAILQDKSISINGKPSSRVVWFWFQKFLGR